MDRLTTVVKLPSLGKPYGTSIPNGDIQISSMLTQDEKMLSGVSKPTDMENVIDSLIRRCTSFPKDMKPSELYPGDRMYLLMMIRAASYGAEYPVDVQCPECRAKWRHTINLMNDLEIKELNDEWSDPFKYELPVSKDTVTLKLFRGDDERAILQYVDRLNRKPDVKSIGDPGFTYRMALHLLGVDSTDPSQSFSSEECTRPGELMMNAQTYVEKMVAMDASSMRDEIDSRTPGLIPVLDLECPKCPNTFQTSFPASPSFFRAGAPTRSHTTARILPHTNGKL